MVTYCFDRDFSTVHGGCLFILMKVNVKVCVPIHIPCDGDILLIMTSFTLWDQYLKKKANPKQSAVEVSFSCIEKCSC